MNIINKRAELILCPSNYDIFSALNGCLKGKTEGLDRKNLIFCEEKVSLMVERSILSAYGGSFNTDVYSFGNYLAKKKRSDNVLSREGSAMAVKKILLTTPLDCFAPSKANLAPSLFELLMQLKSAGVVPEDVFRACECVSGILKNKLSDIGKVYKLYEQFLSDNGYDDQGSVLSCLSSVIEKDQDIKRSDIYLVGYNGWTSQARDAVSALIENARSVTAILTGGDNEYLYLNETAEVFRSLCSKSGVKCISKRATDSSVKGAAVLRENLFNPFAFGKKQESTDKIIYSSPYTVREEIERAAKRIKSLVCRGVKYKEITLALSDTELYGDELKRIFALYDIPLFLDERKKPVNHPLIRLISDYAEVFRKNRERKALCAFIKNPLFCKDKRFTDEFENYLIRYNINYGRIFVPFTLGEESVPLSEYNAFREKVSSVIKDFGVFEMLETLDVKNTLKEFSLSLKEAGELDQAAVNDQIYDAVEGILNQLELILGDTPITVSEFKTLFSGGVSALELSIIPQYADAVFAGGYRETGLACADYLFALGLTDKVPSVKDDVALLTDSDIDKLSSIKISVEPKIKIVNRREKESVGLGLSAFGQKLYLSCPLFSPDGKENVKSEVITYCASLFTVKNKDIYTDTDELSDYYTEKQGLYSFARGCGEYIDGEKNDLLLPAAYYYLYKNSDSVKNIALRLNSEPKLRLEGSSRSVIRPVTSPTVIEDFYACPYKSFASHFLRLKDREEGNVNPLSAGNLIHEIFSEFVKNIDSINSPEVFDKVFKNAVEPVISRPEYKRFFSEGDTSSALNRIIKEAEKFCRKIHNQFTRSKFRPYEFEAAFGFGKKYPPVELAGGKVKLTGKIDRIDVYNDYYRVVDYKTGSVDASDKSLFAGVKLQLYLYAAAVKGKKLAGAFYYPVYDRYVTKEDKDAPMAAGKFLNDKSILLAQDSRLEEIGSSDLLPVTFDKDKIKKASTESALNAYVGYALKVSDKAAEYMLDGVIAQSPYQGTCEYCKYKGLCEGTSPAREVGSVNESTIENSFDGEEK